MQVATISSIFLTITVLYFLVSFGHGLDNALATDSSFVTDDQEQVSNASGTPNPIAMYCQGLGYKYKTVNGPNGQYGMVIFPDGTECKAWDFLQGKCGQEYSYCAKCGNGIKTVSDGENPFSWEYAVCVDENNNKVGSVVEPAKLVEKTLVEK